MTQTSQTVVCPAKKDLAVRWFIAAAIFIGFGVWCLHDSRFFANKVPASELTKADGTPDFNKTATYYLNNAGGIALPLIGLIPLSCGIHALRRKLIADGNGIGYAGRPQIPWAQIRKLDEKELIDRGVLKLSYEQNGQQKQLVLNQADLENFKPLVALVQEKVIGR